MGLDLRLYPAIDTYTYLSLSILELERNDILFELIQNVSNDKGIDLIRRQDFKCICSNDNEGVYKFQPIKEDAFGKPVKFVYASDLKQVLFNHWTDSWVNNNFIKSLENTPNDLLFCLYWH